MAHGIKLGLVAIIGEFANYDQALSPDYSMRRPCTKWNLQTPSRQRRVQILNPDGP
jgi:hypothetical protein